MNTPGPPPPWQPTQPAQQHPQQGGLAPDEPRAPVPWMPPNARHTPHAEKYLLEADALRRRQLRSALLHGSGRTWREQKRIWPSVLAGMVLVAVIVAVFTVIRAVKDTEQKSTDPGPRPSAAAAPRGAAVESPDIR